MAATRQADGPNRGALRTAQPRDRGLLARATTLTTAEIARLDAAETAHALGRDAAWVLLRDRTKLEPLRTWRFAARAAAQAAIETAAAREGLDLPPDQDDYWRVISSPGAGAARAVRFAACALVAPDTLDPAELEYLLEPWARVIGGSFVRGTPASPAGRSRSASARSERCCTGRS